MLWCIAFVSCFVLPPKSAWTQDTTTINPYPRRTIEKKAVRRWTFEQSGHGWRAVNDVQLELENGRLNMTSTGTDPYIHAPAVAVDGPVTVRLRMRSTGSGSGEIFWRTASASDWDPERKTSFSLRHDGERHTYSVDLPVDGTLTQFRLDPGTAPGSMEVNSVTLFDRTQHPFTIETIRVNDHTVDATVRNHRASAQTFSSAGEQYSVGPGDQKVITSSLSKRDAFETVRLRVNPESAPPLERVTVVHHPGVEEDWLALRNDSIQLLVAPDGSGARVLRKNQIVAVIAPLIEYEPLGAGRRIPDLSVRKDGSQIRAEGSGVSLDVQLEKRHVAYDLTAEENVGGPVVRAVGSLEQGLFAGLEYLGEGERSSSRLDIKTPEHLRYAPDPYHVTMPLMSFVTTGGSVAMTWENMNNQPIYATPNFFEGTGDHRMSLAGQEIRGTIRIGPGWEANDRLVDAIEWAVNRRGLPDPPDPPRSQDEQKALCLEAYRGPLNGDGGWGHCVNPEKWDRNYFADQVSAIWRLSGDVPDVPELVPGGAHVANPASFFVTHRLKQWKQHITNAAQASKEKQHEDGSYRYSGTYREGHFENTASGYCAKEAFTLLNHAWYTGDESSLRAGRKTLDYMTRFRTPRGAQTWEVPLHTPDILASAYLVKAYTRGYQLTGDETYLEHARRWAFTGLPFVYQWTDQPIMMYSTVSVYGATNWKAPNWIGRPVQWCGTVYADALLTLDPLDETFDWEKVARGITVSSEQQQYPDGTSIGTLPDSIGLKQQKRYPPDINPGAIVSLRMRLRGELDDVDVAVGDGHRIVAPFPVSIQDGRAVIQSQEGIDYQVLVDGKRIVDVSGSGRDTVSLERR